MGLRDQLELAKVWVRVWIWNQGTRAVKVILRDHSLASNLVKAHLALSFLIFWFASLSLTYDEIKTSIGDARAG